MKILVLTSRFPYPVIGGDRLRIYQICKSLSENYDVDLLSLCESAQEVNTAIDDDVFSKVKRVYLSKLSSYINCLLGLFSSKPLQVSYYKSRKFQKEFNDIKDNYDVVVCHLVRMADYAENFGGYKILEMTDAISLNYSRYRLNNKLFDFKGLLYQLEERSLNKYESSIVNKFNRSFLVSDFDKKYLFPDGNESVLIASNGVDVGNFSSRFSSSSKQLVFIGNMFSSQNLDAAIWFAKHVMPLLLKIDDNFTFKVVGRIKERDKSKLQHYPGTILTGSVSDVASECDNSLAGICSVRLAAGVQNKILEYMAMHLPVITSEEGLQGLSAINDEDLKVCTNANEFAEFILRLSDTEELGSQLSANGYNYVVNNHSWASKLDPINEYLRTIKKNITVKC